MDRSLPATERGGESSEKQEAQMDQRVPGVAKGVTRFPSPGSDACEWNRGVDEGGWLYDLLPAWSWPQTVGEARCQQYPDAPIRV